MIYTVTINPALDINIKCGEVIRPTTIRTQRERRHAGGKGIDVSRVVRNLGGTSVAMGFLGGFTGESMKGLLLEEGLELDFVPIAEETRTNVIINAPSPPSGDRRDHRFNSQGPKVQPVESAKLFEKIERLSTVAPDRRPTHAAICGSLARDMKATYYVNIIRYFKDLGAKVWLDSSGSAIRESLRYPPRPDVVKPNLVEFDELVGGRLRAVGTQPTGMSDEEFLDELLEEYDCQSQREFWRELNKSGTKFFSTYPGVSALIVTLGARGILLFRDGKVHHSWFEPPEDLDFKVESTVGAGDAALAGFVWALEAGKSWEESLTYAVAAAASAVTKPGTEAPDQEQVLSYRKHVETHEHESEDIKKVRSEQKKTGRARKKDGGKKIPQPKGE